MYKERERKMERREGRKPHLFIHSRDGWLNGGDIISGETAGGGVVRTRREWPTINNLKNSKYIIFKQLQLLYLSVAFICIL